MKKSIHLNLHFDINFCEYFLDLDTTMKHNAEESCQHTMYYVYVSDSCRSREADRGEEGRRHIVSLRNSLLFGAVVTLHPVDVTFKNTYDITSTNDDCMYINMYHIPEKNSHENHVDGTQGNSFMSNVYINVLFSRFSYTSKTNKWY